MRGIDFCILALLLVSCAKDPEILTAPEKNVLCEEYDFVKPHVNDTELSAQALDNNRELVIEFCNNN